MSSWRLLVREVYEAGGSKPVNRVYTVGNGIPDARRLKLVEPCTARGRPAHNAPVVLTPAGVAVAENRLQKIDARHGRQWKATWLAALPRTNEVRLTRAVRRAQDDGTCYW